VIAHRGASADAPESTIAAFELALAQGADGLELGIHLSRDEHPVVIHDFTLERTTDGAGPVGALTMRELKRLDAGGWRDRKFRGQRVQTLQEVLERFRDRTRFWVELRGGVGLYPTLEERVVSTLEIYEVLDRTLVQTYDRDAFPRLRGLSPGLRVGALVGRAPVDPRILDPGGADAVCGEAHLLTDDLLGAARRARRECFARKADEPVQVDRLVRGNISGFITGRPGALRARLGR
ncbi:MAG TPA: glycerophosphodiester phosphodiesterase family protein, partial [Streptosporangiaceae bacterium]|nr:glycerophosphodiester phosphodiesterase family protein [Streptosporangiaceae bacterium]